MFVVQRRQDAGEAGVLPVSLAAQVGDAAIGQTERRSREPARRQHSLRLRQRLEDVRDQDRVVARVRDVQVAAVRVQAQRGGQGTQRRTRIGRDGQHIEQFELVPFGEAEGPDIVGMRAGRE